MYTTKLKNPSLRNRTISFKKKLNQVCCCNNFIQRMRLTPLGAHRGQLGNVERHNYGLALLNNDNINIYMNAGVCHDAVAYTRYMLGANITPNNLVNNVGQAWLPSFNYQNGQQWQGNNIPAGRAVGFRDLNNNVFFHSSISLDGGTTVRGINGQGLGDGWQRAYDCNLGVELIPNNNIYHMRNRGRGPIDVWISNL